MRNNKERRDQNEYLNRCNDEFRASFIGNLSSGRFTLPGFLRSFLVSFVIGLLLGTLIPMKKLSDYLIAKAKLDPRGLKARVVSSLVSALVFSPLVTFAMVYLAYTGAKAQGVELEFGKMLMRSEIISIISAFILSFIITPVYAKMIFKERS